MTVIVTIASDATSAVPGSMAVVGLAYPLAARVSARLHEKR
jgi:hypothetical protein